MRRDKEDPPEATTLPADPPKGKPKADNELPEPPLLEAYPDTGQGVQTVTLVGLLLEPTLYRVGKPIPQDISVGGGMYNLSDRAAGIYNFRHN